MRAKIIGRMLSLDPRRLSLERRGFVADDPEIQRRLEAVVYAFATGYNAAMAAAPGELDARTVSAVPPDLRGFAFEGAAMSTGLRDQLMMRRGRDLQKLAAGPGAQYVHLIHVGAGWAYARLRRRPEPNARFARPVLRWLTWDGWGFHQAFFRPDAVFERHAIEPAATGAVRPIRDQGVGRALWFYAGADPKRILDAVNGFPITRRPDLWAGIGLAACYTGAQSGPRLDALLDAAEGYHDHLAQGAAFAAKAHILTGNVPRRSAAAVTALTGAPPATAAGWTDGSLARAGYLPDTPETYEEWRAGIRHAWEPHKDGVTT
ncbi:MAG TPA: DUF1702 family protein [Streptosporangiaceae bacterium]|nr:DUF1702 family protein [Streptosporangiaceae bacterium]